MNHRTRLKRRNARFAGAFYRDDASKWDAKAAARWCAKMNRADRRQLAWLHRIGASPMSIVSHRLQHLNRTINATNRAFGKLLSAAERLRDEPAITARSMGIHNPNVETPLSWWP